MDKEMSKINYMAIKYQIKQLNKILLNIRFWVLQLLNFVLYKYIVSL